MQLQGDPPNPGRHNFGPAGSAADDALDAARSEFTSALGMLLVRFLHRNAEVLQEDENYPGLLDLALQFHGTCNSKHVRGTLARVVDICKVKPLRVHPRLTANVPHEYAGHVWGLVRAPPP